MYSWDCLGLVAIVWVHFLKPVGGGLCMAICDGLGNCLGLFGGLDI